MSSTRQPPLPNGDRRGNTIVLVVGILVLLVIIATSYITRTHAGRITASAQQGAALRDDNARVIAQSIADEIAGALFVRPVVWNVPSNLSRPAHSDAPRLSPQRGSFGFIDSVPVRYGVDPVDKLTQGPNPQPPPDGLPDHPWNFAPYQVVPYTNWPDGTGNSDPFWPDGPGNPGGGTGVLFLNWESNQLGNPGFGDSRWLADTEPVRWQLPSTGEWIFTHWRHMTNLSRPGNGWRICRDISDIGNFTGSGGVVLDLSMPVEQFTQFQGDSHRDNLTDTGLPSVVALSLQHPFEERWLNWFVEPLFFNVFRPGYPTAYVDPTWIPPNFLDLADLNGDNFLHNFGDRPQDELMGGTARWNVGRFLADTDGDGFTDAFWFLAPTMTERGIRQIAAVRIVDNGAMLNANVATRFIPRDPGSAVPMPTRTRGTTPADLALVGELASYPAASASSTHWNVGFYDNPDHTFVVGQRTSRGLVAGIDVVYDDALDGGPLDPINLWARHLDAVGLHQYVSSTPVPFTPPQFLRDDYWRRQGILSLGADPTSPYTPFGIPDEIELRMFHGNNYPWIYSRLEGTTEVSAYSGFGLLRGNVREVESSEYLQQLRNQDLLLDSRRKITLYNGTRNDIMPPWLWPSAFPVDWDGSGVVDGAEELQYHADMRKYDLRRPIFDAVGAVIQDVDRDGVIEIGGPLSLVDDDLDDSGGPAEKLDHLLRIRNVLERVLVIRDPPPAGVPVESYFGRTPPDTDRAQNMAAAMAANIDAYRDQDSIALISEAVPVADQTSPTVRYLGMEAQPFLVEAVIAHVYESNTVAARWHLSTGDQTLVDGDNILCASSPQSTAVAVQIANPFDRPITLTDYSLQVFGFSLDLGDPGLVQQLAPDEKRTYYSMAPSVLSPITVTNWLEVLSLNATDAVDVTAIATWPTSRGSYDGSASTPPAIELFRLIEGFDVLVDRIDSPTPGPTGMEEFGNVVTALPSAPAPGGCGEPLLNDPWQDVIDLNSDTHWAQWVRVSRAWDMDAELDGTVVPAEANELNPRYVFSLHEVRKSDPLNAPSAFGGQAFDDSEPTVDWFTGHPTIAEFSSRNKDVTTADLNELDFPMQMLQKDAAFEQVGELLNVWAFGHEIETDAAGLTYIDTTKTFSEQMRDQVPVSGPVISRQDKLHTNRLRARPTTIDLQEESVLVGVGDEMQTDEPLHWVPDLPAGLRLFEAFVCDGPGQNGLFGVDDPRLAHGFSGKATPGLININTAPFEVMRAAPHGARIVHETGVDLAGIPLPVPFPRTRLSQAVVAYRDRSDSVLLPNLPNYEDRDVIQAGLRGERGFASIGELLLLNETVPSAGGDVNFENSWRIDYAARNPFQASPVESARISTDVVDDVPNTLAVPDQVAGDSEEANLLFSGMSNLITTRSDVFTVYFKIRSFKQDPVTGRWDATNPEYIVDDSRYVMLVDRSEVNSPWDKPKIVYLEKLPK